MQPPAERWSAGTVVGAKYEIVGRIASGGMSTIYKARHVESDRIVAVKILNQDVVLEQMAWQRFQQEAKAASSLLHENLVTVFDYGLDDGRPYIVMPYIEGVSLSEWLRTHGRLDVRQCLSVFGQVAAGLAHVHSKQLVHRDLKPGNVLISRDPKDQDKLHVKIVDFGIAKTLPAEGAQKGQQLTQTGAIVGTPFYMSPEQCQGYPVDHRTDLYSMGCVLFESLFGFPPFAGLNPVETLYKHIHEQLVLPANASRIPEELQKLLLKLLEKDPAKRCQSAAEVGERLKAIETNHNWRYSVVPSMPITDGRVLIGSVIAITLLGFAVVGIVTNPYVQYEWYSLRNPPSPVLVSPTSGEPAKIAPVTVDAPNAQATSTDVIRLARLVKDSPNDKTLWFQYGNELNAAGDVIQSTEAFRQCVKLDPKYGEAWYSLAFVLHGRQQFGEAADAYRRALVLAPDDDDARNNLRDVLWADGKYKDALPVAREIVARNAENASDWLSLGLIQEGMGHVKDAIGSYKKSLDLDPHQSETWMVLSKALRNTGNTKAADDAERRASH